MYIKVSDLIDSGCDGSLQNHLKHYSIWLLSVRGFSQLSRLLLHVLNGHLDGCEVKLKT